VRAQKAAAVIVTHSAATASIADLVLTLTPNGLHVTHG
jgi:putative ABC transport system ATP-binding protein